jgi:hypothetical protein
MPVMACFKSGRLSDDALPVLFNGLCWRLQLLMLEQVGCGRHHLGAYG